MFTALTAKAWFKPAMWLLLIVGAALAFIYILNAYGRSQYQLGRSDKTNEVLAEQQKQLVTLITKVNEIGSNSSAMANAQDVRMANLEKAANAVIADASQRVLLVAGPDGKCRPTEDWRNSWNKTNNVGKPAPAKQ